MNRSDFQQCNNNTAAVATALEPRWVRDGRPGISLVVLAGLLMDVTLCLWARLKLIVIGHVS